MPKATELTAAALSVPQITPLAATQPRGEIAKQQDPAPVEKPVPLQVRLPREHVKAIKVAAAQSEQTISEFMLACFLAYMEKINHV
jgi:hypothetical protein